MGKIRLTVIAAAALAFGSPPSADAAVVERVAAVVGDRPILLSELRLRARPYLQRIARESPDAAQRAAAESVMYAELLDRLIDERLVAQAADRAHIAVAPEEIDRAIGEVAAQNRITPRELLADATRQGLTESEYREEIRRQLLEGKLVQLRVRGRVHVTEQDARAAYARSQQDYLATHPVDLRILVLQIPTGATPQFTLAQHALAAELSRRARAGEDFCKLVRTYGAGASATCGSRGPMPIAALFPELQAAATSLAPGQTSAPIEFRDPLGDTSLLVVQRNPSPPTFPPFELVQAEMTERAVADATDRERRLWLKELRRGVYLDVRL
ncbi:MAG TPA: SurA N-terminal domain-containing protein [Labilithrix sp.]